VHPDAATRIPSDPTPRSTPLFRSVYSKFAYLRHISVGCYAYE
jgi:hypothetical protein